MLHFKVLEVLGNVIKVPLAAKRHMVDLEAKVEVVALAPEVHSDILIAMGSDMEVARHSIYLDVALQPAPLLFVHLLLDSISDAHSELVFLQGRLSADGLAVLVKPVLLQIAHHVGLVGSKDVLHV